MVANSILASVGNKDGKLSIAIKFITFDLVLTEMEGLFQSVGA